MHAIVKRAARRVERRARSSRSNPRRSCAPTRYIGRAPEPRASRRRVVRRLGCVVRRSRHACSHALWAHVPRRRCANARRTAVVASDTRKTASDDGGGPRGHAEPTSEVGERAPYGGQLRWTRRDRVGGGRACAVRRRNALDTRRLRGTTASPRWTRGARVGGCERASDVGRSRRRRGDNVGGGRARVGQRPPALGTRRRRWRGETAPEGERTVAACVGRAEPRRRWANRRWARGDCVGCETHTRRRRGVRETRAEMERAAAERRTARLRKQCLRAS